MKKVLNLSTRQEMSKALAKKYQKVRKRKKTEILDVFVETTGYHRVYARWLLRNWGRKVYEKLNLVKLRNAMIRLQNKLIDYTSWKMQGGEVENVSNFG